MQILSFDTSGPDVQIALMKEGTVVLEQLLPPRQKNRQEAASTLLPGIDRALKELQWTKKQLDLIVVGTGPGSFTGVRVAVITARSIGQALKIGVMPINRLELTAYRCQRPCAVILDAGSGKLYISAYGEDLCNSNAGELVEPFCGNTDELEKLPRDLNDWVLEPGLNESVLAKGKNLLALSNSENLASAAALLAYSRILQSGNLKRESLAEAYPWDNVLPLYLRSPSVTLKAENGSSYKTTTGG